MYGKRLIVDILTDGSGNATVYSDPIDYAQLSQIRYIKDGSNAFSDGVDFAVTAEATGETLWAENDVNASATRAPRQATHSTAGAAALYAATGTPVLDKIAIVADRIKVVISSGGANKAGRLIFVLT